MITPSHYRDMRAKGESAIERRIDQAIRDHARESTHGPITIAASLFHAASSEDFENVLKKYRDAGWSAEYVNDSRDGDFLKLEHK